MPYKIAIAPRGFCGRLALSGYNGRYFLGLEKKFVMKCWVFLSWSRGVMQFFGGSQRHTLFLKIFTHRVVWMALSVSALPSFCKCVHKGVGLHDLTSLLVVGAPKAPKDGWICVLHPHLTPPMAWGIFFLTPALC